MCHEKDGQFSVFSLCLPGEVLYLICSRLTTYSPVVKRGLCFNLQYLRVDRPKLVMNLPH